MLLITKIRLYQSSYTTCYIFKDQCLLADERYYKSLGLIPGATIEIDEVKVSKQKLLKVKTNALFLKPFIQECINSEVYREKVLSHLFLVNGTPGSGTMYLKLILEPPEHEIIDYAWNDKILRLVWMRIEIENAFSWLSTLGGAYSALGDYFNECAEEAGRISVRQYKLSKMLGDDSLAARSKLYSALSLSQKGQLKLARYIVRSVAEFGRVTRDKRLIKMCHGVWAKLKYLRQLKKTMEMHRVSSGDGIMVK